MESFIDRLAERVGIESSFVDALDQTHETAPEKKAALLKAMGLAAEDEAQAENSLHHLKRAEWERALPACAVLHATRPLMVPVTLPRGHGPLPWTVALEGGEQRRGEAMFGDLELVREDEDREQRNLCLPQDLPWGYHRLRLDGAEAADMSLIVSPGRCWLPGEEGSDPSQATDRAQRLWGVAAQVYLLRSERNWGIGDFTDLRRLIGILREHGAEAVGVNPLHGMFSDAPEQASPYSPLSRYLLNVLNIDVESVPGFQESEAAQQLVVAEAFQAKLKTCREATMMAYEDVASLKLPVLQVLFTHFEHGAATEQKESFRAFRHGCDELLRVSCVYEAIRQYLTAENPEFRDTGNWPERFRHAGAEGAAEFTRTHPALIRYHLWLQWVADEQMTAVKQACEGMAVGIYRDLAVGASPSGAEVWSNPDVMVAGAEVGAPPDEWNAAGQNWALPPFHPGKMKEDGYRSYTSLLRTNMRHAGGLRIDHAMALQRLYWIPRGGKPRDGGYVRYPLDDLIGVIALESHRNRCLLLGEDLGTVAPGFRERMAEANILSYRVLLLERLKKGYVPGAEYPEKSLSTASSHDLPTLRGWWEEVDLDLRERLGLTRPENAAKARAERDADRQALVGMFRADGLLASEEPPTAEAFIDAAHRFLLRTPAVLMMAQLEDLVHEPEQVNLPASTPDQYPSWSRRVALTLEDLARDGRLGRLAEIAREERGGQRHA